MKTAYLRTLSLSTPQAATPLASAADAGLEFPGAGVDGISINPSPPVEFGDDKNLVWKNRLGGRFPPSPLLTGNHLYFGNHD